MSTTAVAASPRPGDRAMCEAAIVRGLGLVKTFGATRALRGVDIAVGVGEVRALVGRNGAGKSTLVSLLTGMVAPDAGAITFSGDPAPVPEEREKWQSRVACVYQHAKVVPTLTCAENLFLADIARRHTLISWADLRREAGKVFDHWALDIDADMPASALSVGQRQLLEIARAVLQGSRFVILDEPTAKLDSREIDRLFVHVRSLQAEGVGILFISHHLDEIFDICQTVTVLRDGQRTLDRGIAGLTHGDLIEAMVGSAKPAAAAKRARDGAAAPKPVRLTVDGLSCGTAFHDVTFTVRSGECVGLAGLAGSGKEAIGEVLAGLRRPDAGTMTLDGHRLSGGDVAQHNKAGVGFVPQDRHREGLVLGMSIAENAAMTIPDKLGVLGFIGAPALMRFATRMIRDLDIKAEGPKVAVASLSGGNQQKVVLARAIARDPGALVLINPTSGVDVASKAALFASIDAVARSGAAVVIISDELDELEICDRVLIVRAHRITRAFQPPWSAGDLVAEMEGVQS